MALASVLHAGNRAVTTAGTAVQLSTTKILANWIYIQPKPANTDVVYIGDSTVSSTVGVEFAVGNSGVLWPVVGTNVYDLSTIWVDAAVNGEGVKFIFTSL